MSRSKLHSFGAVRAAAFVSAVLVVPCAFADGLYVSTVTGLFGMLDTNTWTFSQIGSAGNSYNEMAEIGGVLYGDTGTDLYSIDPATGNSSLIGRDPTDYSFTGTNLNGIFYVSGFISGGPSDFYLDSVNFTSGGGSDLGVLLNYSNCGDNDFEALGSVGAGMYAISSGNPNGIGGNCSSGAPTGEEALYTVNPSTLAMTEIGLTGLDVGAANALFSANGMLYLLNDGSSSQNIYSVNVSTGAATEVTTLSFQISSAVETPNTAAPEPGSFMPALLGLAALAAFRTPRML